MLFRNASGNLVSIHRTDYVTDTEYHRCIMGVIAPPGDSRRNTANPSSAPTASHFSSLRAIAKVVPLDDGEVMGK